MLLCFMILIDSKANCEGFKVNFSFNLAQDKKVQRMNSNFGGADSCAAVFPSQHCSCDSLCVFEESKMAGTLPTVAKRAGQVASRQVSPHDL